MPKTKSKAAPPSAEFTEEMAQHFTSEHERDFRLKRDVSYPGNPQPQATFTYFASEEEGEGYYCALCGGRTLPKKIPYGSPERNARVRRRHPEIWWLAPVDVEALGDATPEELIAANRRLEQVSEDFDRGLYAKAARGSVAKATQQRTKAAGRDPRTATRIENAKTLMLESYAMLGNREEAWDELDRLRDDNPALYRELIGDDRPIPYGTKARWWSEIDEDARAAAKALYNQLPEAERKRQAVERRARKVRP